MAVINKQCCKKNGCDTPECLRISHDNILTAVSSINTLFEKDSKNFIQKLFWGYGCNTLREDEYRILMNYSEVLMRYLNQVNRGYTPCLCPEDIDRILEKIQLKTGQFRYNEVIIVDSEGKEDWVMENPGCVAYPDWEKSLHQVCIQPQIQITSIPQEIKLFSYEIESTFEECQLIFDVYNQVKECNDLRHNLEITATQKDCKNEVKIYATQDPKCKLDYDVYNNLKDCKLSYEALNNIVKCGIDVETYNELTNCNIDLEYIRNEQCVTLSKK